MRLILLCVIVLLMTDSVTSFASEAVPLNPVPKDKGYINDWFVLGPFPSQVFDKANPDGVSRDGFDTDFLASLGGEAGARITADTTVASPDGTTASVQTAQGNGSGWISIDEMYKDIENKAAYTFCDVASDTDGTFYGHLESGDALKAWVNGRIVVDSFAEDAEDGSRVKHFIVELKKGPNAVLVKTDTHTGSWAFRLEIYSREDEEKRFVLAAQDLAVTIDCPELPLSADALSFTTAFQPHTLLYTPDVSLTLEAQGGKVLSHSEALLGDSAHMTVPSGYEGLLVLKAKIDDFRGRSFSGTAKAWRGDVEAARQNLLSRIRAIKGAALRKMPGDAWQRHLSVARYYETTMESARSSDKAASALFRAREGTLLEVLPDARAVVEAMESGKDLFADRRGAFRAAYISKADDSVQIYTAWVPTDYDSGRSWPLVVHLHGHGAWANVPSFVSFKGEALSVRVDERGGGNAYTNLAERDVLDVIAQMRRLYNVDAERIYIVGNSMGGYGTWRLASRHPDLFAAAIPFCGMTIGLPLENLANVPVWACHDSGDTVVAYDNSRMNVRLLQSWGYPARLSTSVGYGHSAEQGLRASGIDPLDWLLAQKRPAAPESIVFTSESSGDRRAYWIEIAEFAEPSLKATVNARACGNSVYLRLTNVDTLAVSLPSGLFDRKSPLTINVANFALRREAPLPDALYLHRDADGWQILSEKPVVSSAVRPYVSGSLSNLYQGEPLLVVQGTTGRDDLVKAMASLAKDMSTHTITREPMDIASIPVKRDVDVTDDDIRTRDLVLIGGPSQNAVAKRLADKLPAVEEGAKLAIAGAEYALAGRGYTLFHYNPLATDRLIYIVASDTPEFYTIRNGAIASALDDGASLDFTLSEAQSPKIVRQLSWDKAWHVAERFTTSPLLPDVFTDGKSILSQATESMLRAAAADFIIAPSGNDSNVAAICFDVTAATWADFEAGRFDAELVAFDLSGEDLLKLAEAAGKSPGLRITPDVNPDAVRPGATYLVVAPKYTYFRLPGMMRRNCDTIRYATGDWYADFKRRLSAN